MTFNANNVTNGIPTESVLRATGPIPTFAIEISRVAGTGART